MIYKACAPYNDTIIIKTRTYKVFMITGTDNSKGTVLVPTLNLILACATI